MRCTLAAVVSVHFFVVVVFFFICLLICCISDIKDNQQEKCRWSSMFLLICIQLPVCFSILCASKVAETDACFLTGCRANKIIINYRLSKKTKKNTDKVRRRKQTITLTFPIIGGRRDKLQSAWMLGESFRLVP